jgi:hypothetical protein
MGLRFSFPIELRIDLTSLPQRWKEEVVPFLLEQSITYEGATTVQEEASQAPQSVSVNAKLNDGKRTITSSSSGYQPTPTFLQKGERLFVANSMPILLKHLMLRSLVLGNQILDPGKKLEPVLLLPSATEQPLPLTDVDVCEDPKRLKREWETRQRWQLCELVAFRKYLRFVWDNKVFQFRAVPFGLAIAPLVFTKIVQVVSAHLHTLSIQIHSYLDDSLVKELNPDILL